MTNSMDQPVSVDLAGFFVLGQRKGIKKIRPLIGKDSCREAHRAAYGDPKGIAPPVGCALAFCINPWGSHPPVPVSGPNKKNQPQRLVFYLVTPRGFEPLFQA